MFTAWCKKWFWSVLLILPFMATVRGVGLGIVRNFPVPVPIPVPPNDSGSGSHSIKNISKRKIHNPFCVYFL